MTIHHAIVAKAAKASIILTQEEAEEPITAMNPERNVRVTLDPQDFATDNDTAKAAHAMVADILDFLTTHDDLSIRQFDEDDGGFEALRGGEVFCSVSNEGDLEACLADLFQQIDNPDDGEEADEGDEEERDVSSVVPAGFKKLYKEIGVNGTDNGDWLAAQMSELTGIREGNRVRVDVEKVEELGWANGIDYPAIEGNRGWQGRYRMTMANQLRKVVADQKKLEVPAFCSKDGKQETRTPPADFCERWKTIVKVSKKAAKAEAEAAAELAAEPKKSRAKSKKKPWP